MTCLRLFQRVSESARAASRPKETKRSVHQQIENRCESRQREIDVRALADRPLYTHGKFPLRRGTLNTLSNARRRRFDADRIGLP